jgi:hypothetical protein
MDNYAYIKSEGDLEVVALYEAHCALATIISPDLYDVLGETPNQQIKFKNGVSFDLFLVLVSELFLQSRQSIKIKDKCLKLSLFESIGFLIECHPDETKNCGVDKAYKELGEWIRNEIDFGFWRGELQIQIRFPISNERLLWFGANTVKHNLLRLSDLIRILQGHCIKGGHNFSPQEVVAALEEFVSEIRNRLMYHSTYLVEMLGKLFESINNLIVSRYEQNPTNDGRKMIMPSGLTSDFFCNLYGSVLVFHNYKPERIRLYTPHTGEYLKMRYK